MKKRLRKKLRLGEFYEFGFDFSFHFANKMSIPDHDQFVYDLIDLIEANGLQFGGGFTLERGGGFVTRDTRGSAAQEHRQVVARWLEEHPHVAKHSIGELR